MRLHDDVLHTFPLVEIRLRGRTKEEDEELKKGLLIHPEELAEHNMLVGLGRNDTGKISKFGTVMVEKYHEIERFSYVMYIISTIDGG